MRAVNVFAAVLVISILFAAGCKTVSGKYTAPNGFAAYKGTDGFRAVSPEGVVFKIRTEKNDPFAELDFWREALKKRMVDAGYRFIAESEITAGKDRGYMIELAAPLGSKDYSYMIAIFQKKKNIVIIESAGDVTALKKRQSDIIDAIGKIRL